MRAVRCPTALVFFFFAIRAAGELGIDWAKSAVPPLTKADYLWLRDCVSAKSSADVAGAVSCFREVRNLSTHAPSSVSKGSDVPFPGLRALRNPPIIVVPDCLEFVLRIDGDEPFFRSSDSSPPNGSFYSNVDTTSFVAVESSYPQRRIPGGEYTVLFNALMRTAGYVDGDTLRAGLWSIDSPTAGISSTVADVFSRSHSGSKPILVARGAGCAIAASAASSIDAEGEATKVRALFCLADPPDAAVPHGTFDSDLGLLQRRRGRPLPVVAGPWGDGTGARRCALPGSIIAPVAYSTSLCSADCVRGGWLKNANLVDCFRARSMLDEIECLSSALVKMEEKLNQPESPL